MPANIIKIEPALERRYARKSKNRPQRKMEYRILIVCEGKKTEPYYFEAFKNYNRGTQVYDIEIKGMGDNTINVVDEAISLRNKKKGTNNEYDRVWAVFDKDSFSDERFNAAIDKAERNGVCCAWSNEAFELWYLFHFHNRTTAMSRTEYEKAISKAVNESDNYKTKNKKYTYKKNDPDNYKIMTTYGNQEQAIKWAKAGSENYNDKRYATHNPCTMVYKLVLQLIGKDKNLNKDLNK